MTPGEGGRKRVKAAGGGGGGGRGGERVGGVNRERKRGRGLWQVERETKRMRNLSHEQLQPSGIASKTSFPGSLCLEQSPVLRDPSGVVGDSAAPQVCAPRCGSRREAQQRETRGETGVSGSRPGRTQPARWARYLERGQWRGMDTILDTVGTPQVGQSRAVWLLCRAGDRKDSRPGRFLPPRPPAPSPRVRHPRPESAPRRPRQQQPGAVRRSAHHVLCSQSLWPLDSKPTAPRSGHAATSL